MSIEEKVISMASAAAGRLQLRGAKDFGRYANRVRVNSPQGSMYNGRIGTVVRVRDDTVFVRFQVGATHAMVLPFAAGELEVIA